MDKKQGKAVGIHAGWKSLNEKVGTEGSLILIIAVLFLFFTVTTDKFLTAYNVINLFKQASIYGIVAVGLSFVILTGNIDLSIGAVSGLSALVCAILMAKMGWPPMLAIMAAILAGTAIGAVNGFVIYDMKVVPFIATLGMGNVLRGLMKYMSDATTIANLPKSFTQFAMLKFMGLSSLIWVWFIVVAIGFFVMRYTKLGRNLYVMGSSEEVAKLSGINTRFYTYIPYIISAFLCSIAGIMMTARLNSASPTGGTGFEMNAIASAVIGGVSMSGATGNPFGAALGTYLIMLIQNGGIHLGIDPFIMESISGAMVIIAVFLNLRRERSRKN